VADVTPAESPASWASLAGGQGFQELEAQAVAARSYLMASRGDGGYFGADICDTTACQNYPGIADENTTTDTAVTDTGGATTATAVLLPLTGVPALTQYSASTGGYTAGGTFAAMVDTGDAVCITGACNPYHSYTASIPVSAILTQFPQLGTLDSVDVSQRNGLGDFGGRVLQMELEGSAQTVTITGTTFAADFAAYGPGGALSNWFSVGGQPSGGIGGYWLVGADGGIFSFGNAAYDGSMGGQVLDRPMVGMAATTDDGGYWTVAADGGIFAYDAPFFGSMGAIHLTKPVVAMAATADGGGYWLFASDGGVFAFGDAGFYGSAGNIALTKPVVGASPTPDGHGYWMVASDGGIFAYGDARFQGSLGGHALEHPIVSMTAADMGGYWLTDSNGAVTAFGDAGYFGSAPQHLTAPVVSIADGPGTGASGNAAYPSGS
jgi:hypothetical protein